MPALCAKVFRQLWFMCVINVWDWKLQEKSAVCWAKDKRRIEWGARAPACRMVYRRCRNKMCKQKEELLLQSITMKAASAHKVQTQTGCTMIWWTKEKLWRKLQIVIVTIHTLIEFKNKRMCRSISFQSSVALCLSLTALVCYIIRSLQMRTTIKLNDTTAKFSYILNAALHSLKHENWINSNAKLIELTWIKH